MAPRQGAVARALLCAVCFMFVFVFDAIATLSYGRGILLRIRKEVCGLSLANTGLRCADFDACPTRGKQGQESGRGSREQSERTGRRYRYIRRRAEPLSGDATGYQRRKRKHRGKRGRLFVKLRSRQSRIPLPSIYLANVTAE